jgi:hypothetical protein
MLLLALGVGFGLVLTAVVIAKVASGSSRTPDLGSMSDQWLIAYNASRHSPSL